MARTTITAAQVDEDGVVASLTSANVDGHQIAHRETLFLRVTNGSGSSITVTVQTPKTVGGLALADRSITVGAGATVYIALGNADLYRRAEDGLIYVDFSAVTSVTVQAFYV